MNIDSNIEVSNVGRSIVNHLRNGIESISNNVKMLLNVRLARSKLQCINKTSFCLRQIALLDKNDTQVVIGLNVLRLQVENLSETGFGR